MRAVLCSISSRAAGWVGSSWWNFILSHHSWDFPTPSWSSLLSWFPCPPKHFKSIRKKALLFCQCNHFFPTERKWSEEMRIEGWNPGWVPFFYSSIGQLDEPSSHFLFYQSQENIPTVAGRTRLVRGNQWLRVSVHSDNH